MSASQRSRAAWSSSRPGTASATVRLPSRVTAALICVAAVVILVPGPDTAVVTLLATVNGHLMELGVPLYASGYAIAVTGESATLAARVYQTLEDETAKVADMSSQGSNNLQLSLASVLVKLRTTLSTVALLSTAAQARAAGIKTNIVPTATIYSNVDSRI